MLGYVAGAPIIPDKPCKISPVPSNEVSDRVSGASSFFYEHSDWLYRPVASKNCGGVLFHSKVDHYKYSYLKKRRGIVCIVGCAQVLLRLCTTTISDYQLKPDHVEYTIDTTWLSPQHWQKATLISQVFHVHLTGTGRVRTHPSHPPWLRAWTLPLFTFAYNSYLTNASNARPFKCERYIMVNVILKSFELHPWIFLYTVIMHGVSLFYSVVRGLCEGVWR